MKRQSDERVLTRAEMEVMSILWDKAGDMTAREIMLQYPEPQPAYSTVATFLKILTLKNFVAYHKLENGGKTFYYYPLISREEYASQTMQEVKKNLFNGSFKSMLSFFAQQENMSDEELAEILSIIDKH